VLHLALNPKANSVPAAPPPHTTTSGITPVASNSFSSFYILPSISFMGRVVKLFSQTPGTEKLPCVLEPTLTTNTSYGIESPFSR